MMTGFMTAGRQMRFASVALLMLALAPGAPSARAADVTVNALFNGKAMVMVDGGKPRMLSVGQSTPEGVKLLSATSEAAVIEFKGQRQTLSVGQGTRVSAAASSTRSGQVVLRAERGGHFFADGWINGNPVRFMVDTGATTVSLSGADAQRLGLNYRSGKRAQASTANGLITVYVVQLDRVRVGDITLNNVQASVSEGPSHVALLGMSFLNRTQMNRDGDTLTLVRRY